MTAEFLLIHYFMQFNTNPFPILSFIYMYICLQMVGIYFAMFSESWNKFVVFGVNFQHYGSFTLRNLFCIRFSSFYLNYLTN